MLLDADWRGRRGWLPAWLGAYVLWLNLHAGFVVGLGLVGIHWLEGVIRRRGMQWRLLAGLAAMLGLVLVNPYGADYARYLWRGLFMPRPLIAEWVPLWKDPMLLASFLVALMVTAYALWKNGWTNSRGLLIVLVCAAAAARHMRHSNLFAVAWISYVPGWMQQTPLGGKIDEFWRRRARLVTAVFAVLAIFCLGLTIYKKPWHLCVPAMEKERFGSLMYPVGAVEYLQQQQFSGKVMTPYGAGSFVSWKLYPAVKVGLDSRYEVAYQGGVMEAICEMYDGKPTWRETLQKYRPDLVLAEGRSRLAGLLDKDPQWKCVYRDDAYSLYAWPQTQLPTVDRKGQELVGEFP